MINSFIKKNLEIILAVVVTAIICISGTVFATGYFASDVKYKKEDGTETNVEKALNELYLLNIGIHMNKGTGIISEQNYFSINNLGYKPSEIWLIANKESTSGRLVFHATKEETEYWATAGNKNYYGRNTNSIITENGFDLTADGWSEATINWIAIK